MARVATAHALFAMSHNRLQRPADAGAELKQSDKMFELNHVIFRPLNVYGEFQNIVTDIAASSVSS